MEVAPLERAITSAEKALLPSSDPVQDLPPELSLRIFEFLDYQSAIRLSQVGQFYFDNVKPVVWPTPEKEAFIKKAQFWPRWDRCKMRTIRLTLSNAHNNAQYVQSLNDFEMEAQSYGLGCYSCHRVRPMNRSAKSQVKGRKSKHNPREGSQGYRRFCIDCGIENGVYTNGLCLVQVEHILIGHTGFQRAYCDNEENTLCTTCKQSVQPRWIVLEDDPFAQACRDCHTLFDNDKEALGWGNAIAIHKCKMCGQRGPYGHPQGCLWCKGPVCVLCGSVCPSSRRWWCGRDCSHEAYRFCQDEVRYMYEIGARKDKMELVIERKQRERATLRECDQFEFDEEDLLACLSLHRE